MTTLDKLTVIMPFVNESLAAFTLQGLLLELQYAEFPWEIQVINNWCERVSKQVMLSSPCCNKLLTRGDVNTMIYKEPDRWGHKMKELAAIHPQIIYSEYDKELSHWCAKNQGIRKATGNTLFFIDAHCLIAQGSLRSMFEYYCDHRHDLHGSFHLPIAYLGDAPGRSLMYKPVVDETKGEYHYSFTKYRFDPIPYEVACMSTCGMMIDKNIINSFGGWPEELRIYGGGEHFMNYVLAVLGYKKHMAPYGPLFHEGKDKRGYSSDASEMIRNRFIASYMIGGIELLELYAEHSKGRPETKATYVEEIKQKCDYQRFVIANKQVVSIKDWWSRWQYERNNQGNI